MNSGTCLISVMSKPDFKTAYCQFFSVPEEKYERNVLSHILTVRSRMIYPFARIVNPSSFHHERRLVQAVSKANSLVDIQYDVDFYQHKYVVSSFLKGTLRFRASGKNLMSLAKKVYKIKK